MKVLIRPTEPPSLPGELGPLLLSNGALAARIPLEQFARVTRLLQASSDVQAALAKAGVTLADYVRGSEHRSRRTAEDPDLACRFEDVLRGPGGHHPIPF